MNISIVEEKKNKLVFEIDGMGHTFINLLKTELWNDEHVKIATYTIRHPTVSKPKIIVETDGDESPRNAITSAVARLKKTSEKFKKEVMEGIR